MLRVWCSICVSHHWGSNGSSLVVFSRSLAEACSDGDVNAVRKLLDEGRSVNEHTEEGESLLCLACSAGYYELAQVSVPFFLPSVVYDFAPDWFDCTASRCTQNCTMQNFIYFSIFRNWKGKKINRELKEVKKKKYTWKYIILFPILKLSSVCIRAAATVDYVTGMIQ